jgi:hypothetical protein
VLGVHPEYSGLLEIEVELDPYPPRGWEQGFNHPEGVGISLSMHPPRLSGSTIYIMPPDKQVEDYIKHIDERIDAANAIFEKRHLPELHAAEDARNKAEDEKRQRLEEAQRKLKNL